MDTVSTIIIIYLFSSCFVQSYNEVLENITSALPLSLVDGIISELVISGLVQEIFFDLVELN